MIPIDQWENCYSPGWGDLLRPAAYSHPAKMSRSLVFKIIAHALEENWIQPGQTVLDPFAGVGTTALPSLMAGLNYIGVELEEKFVELGRQNIDLWNSRFSGMPKWTGSAQLLQGDSRRLCEVVSAAGLVVSSPPYASAHITNIATGRIGDNSDSPWKQTNGDNYGSTPGQLATLPPGTPPNPKPAPLNPAVISSPPFAGNTGGRGEASRNGIEPGLFDRHSGGMKGGTGSDPANLDHLPQGRIEAVIGSPPYAEGLGHDAGHPRLDATEDRRRAEEGSERRNGYGSAPGQLGAMAPGEVSAVVGSPPFEKSDLRKGGSDLLEKNAIRRGRNPYLPGTISNLSTDPYGSTAGQIGATQGDTFWSAARLIVEQCALILPPGGAAIWVVKNYIKSGVEVDFTGQWQALCEACGFETVHIHRAMLVKKNGEQETMAAGHDTTRTTTNLLGEEVTTAGKALANKKNTVARKSFFRRLHERRRPDLAIDWETVLCTRKRAAQ